MKIALIGANGQLGTDLAEAIIEDKKFSLIALTHKNIDIRNKQDMAKMLAVTDPDIVIDTAAYHKVDIVEDNPEEAFLVNSVAVKNLAELCASKDRTLVFISTDYVFGKDRCRRRPYTEADIPAPVNVYGASKVAGEHLAAMCPRHYIIRTSGLFGIAGSSGKGGNFVETMLRLAREKGEVRVVNDQVLSPTYTVDLARQIVYLLKVAPYGLYHAVSRNGCSWFDFAKRIFRATGMRVKCRPIPSCEFPTRAERPKYSVLKNARLEELKISKMHSWQKSLKDYLAEKRI